MFGISGTELIVIAAFALFVFGPDKLPQLARTAGRIMAEFKRAQDTMEATIRAEMYAPSDEAAEKVLSSSVPAQVAEEDDEDEEEEE